MADAVGLGWVWRIGAFSKFPRDADNAGLEPLFESHSPKSMDMQPEMMCKATAMKIF